VIQGNQCAWWLRETGDRSDSKNPELRVTPEMLIPGDSGNVLNGRLRVPAFRVTPGTQLPCYSGNPEFWATTGTRSSGWFRVPRVLKVTGVIRVNPGTRIPSDSVNTGFQMTSGTHRPPGDFANPESFEWFRKAGFRVNPVSQSSEWLLWPGVLRVTPETRIPCYSGNAGWWVNKETRSHLVDYENLESSRWL